MLPETSHFPNRDAHECAFLVRSHSLMIYRSAHTNNIPITNRRFQQLFACIAKIYVECKSHLSIRLLYCWLLTVSYTSDRRISKTAWFSSIKLAFSSIKLDIWVLSSYFTIDGFGKHRWISFSWCYRSIFVKMLIFRAIFVKMVVYRVTVAYECIFKNWHISCILRVRIINSTQTFTEIYSRGFSKKKCLR